MTNIYNQDLNQNPANHQPLTPLTFLERAASTFPEHTAIIHGNLKRNYSEFYARSRKLASVLTRNQISVGDTVSVMLANTPPMLEAHYAVPMTGAVLHSMNTRLDAKIIAFQLDHSESKIVIVDREFSPTMKEALEIASVSPQIVVYDDPEYDGDGVSMDSTDYEEFIKDGDPEFSWRMPSDEWDAISLNYTSGTTGNPKGVVYHHRGAYLLAQGNALTASMPKHSVYLWTLPMFHCNGWCFPWTLSAIVGTHVCLRAVRQKPMWDAIADHGVTHMCGAPIVMSTLLSASDEDKSELPHVVEFFTAAAPPPEAVLAAMKDAGFNVTHLYGLTECYGPAVVNDWHEEWNELDSAAQAGMKARQGVRYSALEALDVKNPETMESVARDGETIGEVMMQG
ncbi:MAG: AMP-binding protein, partial [Pseudomonadota bacterium]